MTITLTRPARAVTVAIVVVILVAAGLIFWRVDGQDPTDDSTDDSITVPYDDTQSGGLLTLCSADGKAVTEGSVDDQPFADIVIGETALPSDLDPTGAVATLFAYQPREGVSTTEFSGTAITAAGLLPDPKRPAARVPDNAWSIGDFVTAYPADDDGFVQLRLYLGTPQAGTLSESPYDTADLRVDGSGWELVRGGNASCADAESLVR